MMVLSWAGGNVGRRLRLVPPIPPVPPPSGPPLHAAVEPVLARLPRLSAQPRRDNRRWFRRYVQQISLLQQTRQHHARYQQLHPLRHEGTRKQRERERAMVRIRRTTRSVNAPVPTKTTLQHHHPRAILPSPSPPPPSLPCHPDHPDRVFAPAGPARRRLRRPKSRPEPCRRHRMRRWVGPAAFNGVATADKERQRGQDQQDRARRGGSKPVEWLKLVPEE